MMRRRILVTGGAGFIGSNLVRHLVTSYPDYLIINIDKLTYAGNLENLSGLESAGNYRFERMDICDAAGVARIFEEYHPDSVIHLAAESHVDRSIGDPLLFAQTNVMGTLTLLHAALRAWAEDPPSHRFYHVSTDEVYGSLRPGDPPFTEETPYSPRSAYSASKASSDHFVRAFHQTHGLGVVLSNCSNNYGAYQFPEKLIPLFINNICQGRALPVYGSGQNIRDWLWVGDHVQAIDRIFHQGRNGQTYNIGGNCELTNLELVHRLIALVDSRLGRAPGTSLGLITHVADRAGHDFRYAIDSTKLAQEFGWQPSVGIEEGLAMTVDWYLEHRDWLTHVTSGEYTRYYEQMYGSR